MGNSFGYSGEGTPDTNGENVGVEALLDTSSAERVTPLNRPSSSLLVVADPGNEANVEVGFDPDMTFGDGIPLTSGGSVSIDINIQEQPLYAIPDTAGDELRIFITD